jgi:hypothetical protein
VKLGTPRRSARETSDFLTRAMLFAHRSSLQWMVPYAEHQFARLTYIVTRLATSSKGQRTSERLHRDTRTKQVVLMQGFSNLYVRNLRKTIRQSFICLPISEPRFRVPKVNLDSVGIFHLHFIDGFGRNLGETRTLIDRLKNADVKIVWTAHDLTPHSKDHETFDPIFRLWASVADGVIHHSAWGERKIRELYQFKDSCQHVIIKHCYPSSHRDSALLERRSEIEKKWGLEKVPIRIGILGSPREERKVEAFLEGVALSTNPNIEVACWSLRHGDNVPNDPRIAIHETYRFVSDRTIRERLALCDLIALPIDSDGEMLTTGILTDALAMGCGVLSSEWEYLRETAGLVSIPCGHTVETIVACLNSLDVSNVARVRKASEEIRPLFEWSSAHEPVLLFYEKVLISR